MAKYTQKYMENLSNIFHRTLSSKDNSAKITFSRILENMKLPYFEKCHVYVFTN